MRSSSGRRTSFSATRRHELGRQSRLVVLIVSPLLVLWVVALFPIVLRRPGLSVLWKGIRSAVVILTGYVGLFLYVAFRPPRSATQIGANDAAATRAALRRLGEIVESHDAGSMSDEEFARRKAEMFGLESTTT